MLLYCEVLRHRWSWEWKGLGFNGRCLQLIAARCGFAGNHELFSRSIGEVEAALGDVANFAKAQWIDLWTPIEYEPEPKLEPKPKQANDGKRPPAPAKP